MCADCHSTNLQKNYQSETDQFKTTWSEISVGCEACHGPGSHHIQWATDPDQKKTENNKGLTTRIQPVKLWTKELNNLTTGKQGKVGKNQELEACARCHSRRTQLSATDYASVDFNNHFNLSLLTPALYHPDGQIKDEVFEYGSFLQSKMYDSGVTCSNCHNPHSQKLRLPKAQVCSQCHDSSIYNNPKHTLHPVMPVSPNRSTASKTAKQPDCLDCHMPAKKFMVIDARRDHSFRIPRPDLTLTIGTPNACQTCHNDKSPQWAADIVKQSSVKVPQGYQSFAEAFYRAEQGKTDAAQSLLELIRDVEQPEIVRATALQRLRPYLSAQSAAIIVESLQSDSDLIRHSAVQLATLLPPQERQAYLTPLLEDPLFTIRIEAARSMGAIPIHLLDLQTAEKLYYALQEFESSQAFNSDRPESHLNLGNLASEQQFLDKAAGHYQQALKLDPGFSPARVNLIETIRRLNGEPESMKALNQALIRTPNDPALHMAYGFAMVRQKQPEAALTSFARAVELVPENSRYLYIYGMALQTMGNNPLAIKQFQKAYQSFPANPDVLRALLTAALQNQNLEEALKYGQELNTIIPGNPQIQTLIRQLKGNRLLSP